METPKLQKYSYFILTSLIWFRYSFDHRCLVCFTSLSSLRQYGRMCVYILSIINQWNSIPSRWHIHAYKELHHHLLLKSMVSYPQTIQPYDCILFLVDNQEKELIALLLAQAWLQRLLVVGWWGWQFSSQILTNN